MPLTHLCKIKLQYLKFVYTLFNVKRNTKTDKTHLPIDLHCLVCGELHILKQWFVKLQALMAASIEKHCRQQVTDDLISH